MEQHQYAGNWVVIPGASQNQSQNPTHHHLHHHHFHHHQHQQHHHPDHSRPHPHQSLASHFHLLHLVENLADAIESGTRDQHSDALVNDLSTHFDKCQQLLNSISGSMNARAMTVEGQKHKLEEHERLLNQRRDLIAKYRGSVEELVKSDGNK